MKSKYNFIRVKKSTDEKVLKLQDKLNRGSLTHVNKGEVVDVAVTDKLEKKEEK